MQNFKSRLYIAFFSFRDIEECAFVRSCAQSILSKFGGLISKLRILEKSY